MLLDVDTDAWHALAGGPKVVERLCAGLRYPAEPRAPFVWADGSAKSSDRELRVRSVHKRTLPFYEGWSLYALDVVPPSDHYEWTRALFVANDSFIALEDRAVPATDAPGDRPPVVHLFGKDRQFASLNVPGTLTLTPENSLEYLEFFCATVGGNDGPWILLSASTDVVEGAWSPEVWDLLKDFDLRQWRALLQQAYQREYAQAKVQFLRARAAYWDRQASPDPETPATRVPRFSLVRPDKHERLLQQGHEDVLRHARHRVVPPRLVATFGDAAARVLRYKVVLQYRSSIFKAALDVMLTTGNIEMPYDWPLVNRVPIATCETLSAPLIGITYYARPKASVSWLSMPMEEAEVRSGSATRHTYLRGVFRGDLDLRHRVFKKVVLDRCIVEGSLLLDDSTFVGGLEIMDCRIAGGLSAHRVSIKGPTRIALTTILGCSASADAPHGLACGRSQFDGDVTLDRVDVLGKVDFQDTTCSGVFTIEGIRLRENEFWDRWGASRVNADLVLTGSRVATLRLAGSAPSRGLPRGTWQRNEIAGRVQADVRKAEHLELADIRAASLTCKGATVSRKLTIRDCRITSQITADVKAAGEVFLGRVRAAAVSVSEAEVSGHLEVEDVRARTIDLHESKAAGIKCARVKASSIIVRDVVCGSASFRQCRVVQDLNLAGGRVTGNVQVEQSVVRDVLRLSGIAGSDVGIVGSLVGTVEVFTGTMNRLQIRPDLDTAFRPMIISRFEAVGMRVGAQASFWGLHCHTDFLMTNCSVEGPVVLWSTGWERTLLGKSTPDTLKMLPAGWIPTTSIGGELKLTSLSAASLNLCGVTVGGRVVLDHLQLSESLSAGAYVEQNCRHQPGHVLLRFTCGSLSMENAKCGGDADLSGLQVTTKPHVALRPHGKGTRFWLRRPAAETDIGPLEVVRAPADQPDVFERGSSAWRLRERPDTWQITIPPGQGHAEADGVVVHLLTATDADVSARRLKVDGELWLWRAYGPGDHQVAFASIDGKLDLSDAASTRLSISGNSFDKDAWQKWATSDKSSPWWVSFERGKFEEFALNEPFPFAVSYDQITVGQWDVRPEKSKSLLDLLRFSYPFRKTTYLAIVKDRRNAGDDEAATKIWDAMHVRDFTLPTPEEVLNEDSQLVLYARRWRHSRGWRFLRWPFDVLWHLAMRYFTHFLADTRPLLNLWLILLLLSVGVFSTKQNIAPSSEFMGENSADDKARTQYRYIPFEEHEVLDDRGEAITTGQGVAVIETYPKEWGVIEAFTMAVRYNVPLATLLTERLWEPAQEGSALVLNPLRWDSRCDRPGVPPSRYFTGAWEHCQSHVPLPISPQDWASIVSILNWVIVPMFLYGRIARKLSDVR